MKSSRPASARIDRIYLELSEILPVLAIMIESP
jgi:hypothetical protein